MAVLRLLRITPLLLRLPISDMSMTIEEVKAAKEEFNKSVFALITQFEADTGMRIRYIDLKRQSEREYYEDDYLKRPISGISAELELDLL